jgi:excisionase family DNA binding protein
MSKEYCPKEFCDIDYINIKELCRRLSVSRSMIFRLMSSTSFPYTKIGKATRFRYSEVISFLENARFLNKKDRACS